MAGIELKMRRCCPDDLKVLRELSVETFLSAFGHYNTPEDIASYCGKTFGEEPLRRQMGNLDSSFWFLETDGTIAGYMKLNIGAAQTEADGDDAMEIERIYVSAAFQGLGLGAYMIEQAVSMARDMGKTVVWLGVWELNVRAIRFYETHGFSRFGTHIFFLGSDEQTDILMQREIV